MTFPRVRAAHANLSSTEIADRIAIRELIDAYAHHVDRRDVEGQMSLFTEDTMFWVFMDSKNPEPTQTIKGREGLRPVFENLKSYEATTHFNGQSTIMWEEDRALGVSYCLAHHVKAEGAKRTIMIASIRYLDHFVKVDGFWYYKQRKLMVDWIDNRDLATA